MVETLRFLAKWARRGVQALGSTTGLFVVCLLILLPVVPLAILIDSLPIHSVPTPVWLVFFVVGAIGKWVAFRWGHYRLSEAFAIGALVSLIIPIERLYGVIRGHIWLELVAGVIAIGIAALLLGGPSRPQPAAGSPADKR